MLKRNIGETLTGVVQDVLGTAACAWPRATYLCLSCFFFFPFSRARYFRTADARRKMPGGAQHTNRLDDWQIPALSTWQMSWWDEL
jgi:hypothetical protein